MKPFCLLPCNNLLEIQHQSMQWLTKYYDLGDQSSLATSLWLKIDFKNFLHQSPELMKWFSALKLFPSEVAVTVVNSYDGAGLHVDEPPVTAKINIPVFNYTNVYNEWYDVPESEFERVGTAINSWGKEYYDLRQVNLNKCKCIGRVQPDMPIVFNSQIPHRVVCDPGARFPRVMLTCMFYKEPIQYLRP